MALPSSSKSLPFFCWERSEMESKLDSNEPLCVVLPLCMSLFSEDRDLLEMRAQSAKEGLLGVVANVREGLGQW